MDGHDSAILELAAANTLVVPAQAEQWVQLEPGVVAGRLDGLLSAGLLARELVLAGGSPCYRITRAGLDTRSSNLPVPVLDLGTLRHDIGVGWLWMAARRGAFGEAEWVRSRASLPLFGEPDDADLVLSVSANWVAVHLLAVVPSRAWVVRVLRRYASDPRYAAAFFLVERREAGELVDAVAAELGVTEMTRTKRVAEISG